MVGGDWYETLALSGGRIGVAAGALHALDVEELCRALVEELLGGRPVQDDVVVVALRLLPTAPYSTRSVDGDVPRATIAPPRSRASRS